jgi:low affinity Fe/Cu permease
MNFFDRVAASISKQVAHAWFFVLCLMVVIIWTPTLFLMDINTSQLIINTTTTIITFLLVALLQNSQQQFENAMNAKLDAQTKAIAALLQTAQPNNNFSRPQIKQARRDLLKAIRIEEEIGTDQ